MLSLFMISSRYMKAATIAEKINNPWSETLKYNSVILSSCIADFEMWNCCIFFKDSLKVILYIPQLQKVFQMLQVS